MIEVFFSLSSCLEQYVDDEDVEHVLQGVEHAVEHSFQLGNAFDGLQGS